MSMKLSRVLVSTALAAMLGGCPAHPPQPGTPPGEGPPPVEDPPAQQGPFLSDTPLWTMEAPESLRLSCYGNSIALGDVNGDGKKDLVVAAPPCSSMTGKGSVALYAGDGSSFSAQPIIAEMDWQNPNPAASGRAIVVSIGNVNGDGFADILVRSQSAGTLVFAGKADLSAVFQAPLFRVPFAGPHYAGFLSDLDGDGLDDLVINQASTRRTGVYRATPTAETPFTFARMLPDRVNRTVRAGDVNGDGMGDVLLVVSGVSKLYSGCKVQEPEVCEGMLSVSPSWTAAADVVGFFPDQNGDGHAEVVRGYQGRVAVHLFQPEGGISDAPIWSILADAAFPGFSVPPALAYVGDLDKDNKETEFLLSAFGRLYAFFPKQGLSAEVRPDWAWPKSNSVGPDFPGYVLFTSVGAGDLNADGYADFVAGLAPPLDQLTPTTPQRPGRVVAYGGGKVPPLASAPFLRLPASCGLAAEGGKPDVTVDADVISRSVYVERRNFPETACEVAERCVGAPGDRRLLRFSVSIPNLGSGAVRIPSPTDRPELFEFDACHQHDHLVGFASYELVSPENAVVAVGRKQGFFLADLVPYCGDAPAPFVALDGSQGISPGWADVYAGDYPCQWLDITDVPDGTYSLRVGVDKNDLLDEADVHPNSVDVKVKISGTTVEVVP